MNEPLQGLPVQQGHKLKDDQLTLLSHRFERLCDLLRQTRLTRLRNDIQEQARVVVRILCKVVQPVFLPGLICDLQQLTSLIIIVVPILTDLDALPIVVSVGGLIQFLLVTDGVQYLISIAA